MRPDRLLATPQLGVVVSIEQKIDIDTEIEDIDKAVYILPGESQANHYIEGTARNRPDVPMVKRRRTGTTTTPSDRVGTFYIYIYMISIYNHDIMSIWLV